MENQIYLFLYSNFSPYSKMLINIIKTSPLQTRNINVNFICIDNNNVKKIISRSKNIKIKYVPCIFILNSNGNIEQFEGKKAFEWTEQMIQSLTPQPPPQSQFNNNPQYDNPQNQSPYHQPQQQFNNPPQQPSQPPQPPQNQRENNFASEPKSQPKRPTKSSMKQQQEELQQLTSIDDLESEEDILLDDEDVNPIISKPPASIRNGPGNFESDAEFGEQIEVNRTVKRGITESTVSGGKKGNIMAIAAEMQKKREKEDTKKDRKRPM